MKHINVPYYKVQQTIDWCEKNISKHEYTEIQNSISGPGWLIFDTGSGNGFQLTLVDDIQVTLYTLANS